METNKEEAEVLTNIDEHRASELNIQSFMNDMRLLGEQVGSNKLAKPPFNYGDLGVTNYLLWLLLGEMTILNNNLLEE